MRERGNVALLLRDRVHACSHVEAVRVPELDESEEALDRGQPDVTGADAVAPFRFEMVKECEDGVDVEMPDLESAGADAVPVRGEGREQPEARHVAFDGVRAGAPVTGEMLPQERGQRGCEWGHDLFFPVVM